ncbi:MAG: gliding motility-associated C-terminal domain-containing protein [Bacteroidetes bacterium]|nr:gliding motility-associated C-terminal domain-containing protein [Bacteroidota bacterium]MDA0929768.1 gliding motility-associated C-terminal domain-containing protein [Bacteroidota bacterium]
MSYRHIVSVISALIFLISGSVAQFHNHRWLLGLNADPIVNFSQVNNFPAVAAGHALPYADQGNGVINHPNSGQLLAYTNGNTIWDNTHTAMPNGNLAGLSTCASNGQVSVDPGNCNQFYFFYAPNNVLQGQYGPLMYAKVDVSLPGNGTVAAPLGDVPNGSKDLVLHPSISDAFEIAKGQNSNLYFLYAINSNGDSLLSWRIDATGITPLPAIQIPFTLGEPSSIRHSVVNQKLAITSLRETDAVLVADYALGNGTVTNLAQVPSSVFGASATNFEGNYDAEWSPDGTKLYISKIRSSNATGGRIYQYDLNNPGLAPMQVYSAGANNSLICAGIKLAPDNVIYFIRRDIGVGFQYLGGIANPNAAGMACNPQAIGLNLNVDMGFSFKISETLPGNLKPITQDLQVVAPCTPMFTNLQADVLLGSSDADNPNLIVTILSTSANVNATINNGILNMNSLAPQTGPDTVFFTVCDDYCFSRCDTGMVIIIPSAPFGGVLPTDTILCASGQNITLNTGLPAAVPQVWSNGTQGPQTVINQPGIYYVDIVGLNGCLFRDSISVNVFTPVNLGSDRLICGGIPPIIDASCPGCTYQWSTGATTSSISPQFEGEYFVTITSICGVSRDTVWVSSSTPPSGSLGPDRLVCDTALLSFDFSCFACTYELNNQPVSNPIEIQSSGTYWVQVSNDCGTLRDTFTVVIGTAAEFNMRDDSLVCPGDTALLTTNGTTGPLVWNTGSTADTILVTTGGWYLVTWNGACGSTTDSIFIKQLTPGQINLGPDITVCDSGLAPLFIPNLGTDAQYLWWNGSTSDTAFAFQEENYAVNVQYCGEVYRDTIFVRYTNRRDGLFLANSFTPNGDGLNEIYYVRGVDPGYLEYQFMVFNRWGNLVFESTNPKQGWNAWKDAEPYESDVFAYRVFYISPCRTEYDYLGKLNVLR